MPLDIILIVIGIVAAVSAWRTWAMDGQTALNTTRRRLFVGGLLAASLALATCVAFVLYTYRIGGFGTHFSAMLKWARPGVWISFTSLILVTTGRGRSRLIGIVYSLLMFALWAIPIWGM